MHPDEDDFSDFRSAIEWQMRPRAEEATGDFKWLSEFFPPVLEFLGTAYILAPQCESPIEVELGARLRNALDCVEGSSLLWFRNSSLDRFGMISRSRKRGKRSRSLNAMATIIIRLRSRLLTTGRRTVSRQKWARCFFDSRAPKFFVMGNIAFAAFFRIFGGKAI
jgi:hypothetical protein